MIQVAYNSSILASTSRYEFSLEKSLYKALHELQRLQGMRQGRAVLTPLALDVYSE